MTREEYYRQRRIYRKFKACFKHPSFVGRSNTDEINADVFLLYWGAIERSFPEDIRVDREYVDPLPAEKPGDSLYQWRYNVRHLPNSYPHKTRNP